MHLAAKQQGLLNLLPQHPNAAVIAWFPQSQQQWQALLQQHHIQTHVMLAKQVNALQLTGRAIILVEHYPLASKEDAFLQTIPEGNIFVLSALDEPLLAKFGGDRVADLMKKMGMQENDVVEHALVTKSLRNAQEKLEKRITMEQTATSMQEWFAKNSG